jgi:hypothetical protein
MSATARRQCGVISFYFVALGISAAGMLVLGGEVAVPGGECAPAASMGLDSTGVTGAT